MTTLTDIGAELEAIAGIGLDDNISRLGGAGYTKGLFMDILKGRVAVPANVSRLSARGRMMALFSTIGPQFYAPRTSSITQTRGAGTPTITRATVATVMGYGPTAVLADGQTLLAVASGELRFQGGRRISEGVWSDVDANGVPIPAATRDGSVVEAAATNLCLQSQDFATTWNPGTTVTIAANQYSAPDGTTTVDKITAVADSSQHGVRQGGLTYTAAIYTASIYLRYVNNQWCGLVMFDGATARYATFDLLNGVVGNVTANTTSTIEATAISGIYRCSITSLMAAGSGLLDVYLSNNSTADYHSWLAAGTEAVGAWGAQLELGSYATTYQATGAAAATRNKDVLDDQVASNLTAAAGSVAFQWTPSHAPSGTVALAGSYVDASNYTMLLAQKVTNLYSSPGDLTNAAWTKANSTAAKDQPGAPDGTATAQKITASASNAVHGVIPASGVAAGGTFIAQTRLKVGSVNYAFIAITDNTAHDAHVVFDLVAGTASAVAYVGTKVTLGAASIQTDPDDSSWYICTLKAAVDPTITCLGFFGPANSALASAYSFNAAGTEYILAWHPQLESVASQVSQFAAPYTATTDTFAILRKVIAGAAYDAYLAHAYVSGTTYDIALKWGANGSNLAVDGVLGTSHANTTAAQLGTRWQWGADGNGGQQAGAAFKEKYLWTRALSDSELQAVTA